MARRTQIEPEEQNPVDNRESDRDVAQSFFAARNRKVAISRRRRDATNFRAAFVSGEAMNLFGIKFIGLNAENGRKLLLTLAFILAVVAAALAPARNRAPLRARQH